MFGQVTTESGTVQSGGLLPALQNIVTGVITAAPTVVSSYLEMQRAKEQAKLTQQTLALEEARRAAAIAAAQAAQAVPGAPVNTRYAYPYQAAGFDLKSGWPILGIIAIGAFLLLKGTKGSAEVRVVKKRQRRR